METHAEESPPEETRPLETRPGEEPVDPGAALTTQDSERLSAQDLRDAWPVLFSDERLEGFVSLPRPEAEDFFLGLDAAGQAEIVLALPRPERRSWIRLLAPDDAADLIQNAGAEREDLVALLDQQTRHEVAALLAYAEDDAGGLMNPRFARVRPDMTADEALAYLRRQTRERVEMIYYAYVLDQEQHLLGVVSFRELFAAPGARILREIMRTDVVRVLDSMDQEALSKLFQEQDLIALPVVDAANRMKGIVTVDDIVDVVQEEGTEDIQKLGAVAALDQPYMEVSFVDMLRKRSPWLIVLLFGQILTRQVIHGFERQIAVMGVLGAFVPMIMSSGGNSGSQASTLVMRAIALGELRLRDWWRVFVREVCMGAALGALLGLIGLGIVLGFPGEGRRLGNENLLLGGTIGCSLVAVVLWGALVGSMLPFLLRRAGLDPAAASAPLVATLSDVTGLVIYFTVASLILGS